MDSVGDASHVDDLPPDGDSASAAASAAGGSGSSGVGSDAYLASLAAAPATLQESIDRGEAVCLARLSARSDAEQRVAALEALVDTRTATLRRLQRASAIAAGDAEAADESSDDDEDLPAAQRAGGVAGVQEELAHASQALLEAQVRPLTAREGFWCPGRSVRMN